MKQWTKEIPADGWHWIKYRNKKNKNSICPCFIERFDDIIFVSSSYGDIFIGNKDCIELRNNGSVCLSVRFGSNIPAPN